jgi:glyoxylase-like metal-dependent hydrolase (beta-lactamase superfamily II)
MKMKVIMLTLGPIQANCYVVYDEETKESMVIDPGAEGKKIFAEIEKNALKVKYIVNTHGHGDHIGANQYIKEATGAELLIHKEDAPMLTDPQKNMSVYMTKCIDRPPADRLLNDGDTLELGKNKFTVLHTPGHSPGGICLLSGKLCFTGDTIFRYSIGRTDLPGGNYHTLINAIQNRLMVLDENTIILPGHGPQTSVGLEKTQNPFLN